MSVVYYAPLIECIYVEAVISLNMRGLLNSDKPSSCMWIIPGTCEDDE